MTAPQPHAPAAETEKPSEALPVRRIAPTANEGVTTTGDSSDGPTKEKAVQFTSNCTGVPSVSLQQPQAAASFASPAELTRCSDDVLVDLVLAQRGLGVVRTETFRHGLPPGVVGKGGFGVVFKARNAAGQDAAVKRIDGASKVGSIVDTELKVLQLLRHGSIVSFLDAFVYEDRDWMFISMEYVDGGDLMQALTERPQVFDEALVRPMMFHIACALGYAHELGVMHRDIKPENILVRKDYFPKVTDFGLARVVRQSEVLLTVVGTPCYIAPEINDPRVPYDFPADVFSMGLVFAGMVDDRSVLPVQLPPGYDGTEFEQRLLKKWPPNSVPEPISQGLREVWQGMVRQAPGERPTFHQLCSDLTALAQASGAATTVAVAAFVAPCLRPSREDIRGDPVSAVGLARGVAVRGVAAELRGAGCYTSTRRRSPPVSLVGAILGAGAVVASAALRRSRALSSRHCSRVALAAEGNRVVVTGLGVVSPHGNEKDAWYEKLLAGTSAVKTITKFDPEGLPTRIAAQIDGFDASGYVEKKNVRRMDDVVKYTIVSGKKALEDAGLGPETEAFKALDKERCGILIGSAMGGTSLQVSIDNMDKLLKGKKLSPFFVPYTLINVPGGLLAIDVGFKGPNYAVVTACATGNYCISTAAGHIQRGECDLALAGGAEAPVTRAGIAGFVACKALSTRNDEPERASRPWDKARDGFVMGEGAGVLCLESLEHAQQRGATIYAEYLGGAFTCDAHHMTEPHPKGDGVSRCIKLAMADAGVSPDEVGYMNCHGTSTPAGDMAEVRAIQRAFDGKTDKLVVNSTKCMLGHCLGAAAGIEAVATVQALRHQKVHPTINLEDREDGFDLNAPTEALELPSLQVASSNSFGFGGHNSCVLFRRFQ